MSGDWRDVYNAKCRDYLRLLDEYGNPGHKVVKAAHRELVAYREAHSFAIEMPSISLKDIERAARGGRGKANNIKGRPVGVVEMKPRDGICAKHGPKPRNNQGKLYCPECDREYRRVYAERRRKAKVGVSA